MAVTFHHNHGKMRSCKDLKWKSFSNANDPGNLFGSLHRLSGWEKGLAQGIFFPSSMPGPQSKGRFKNNGGLFGSQEPASEKFLPGLQFHAQRGYVIGIYIIPQGFHLPAHIPIRIQKEIIIEGWP